MSEEVEGTIKVLYDDDDVISQSKATANAIGSMSDSIEQDLSAIGATADNTGDDLSALGNKGKTSMDKLGNASDNAATSVKETALEVFALGETFSGVAEQVFSFEEKLLSLERSMFGIDQTALGLKRQIEDFNDAMAEGTLNVTDQERAVEDINQVYKDLTLQEKEAAGQAQALNGEFVSFGISLTQTIALSAIMLKQFGLTDIALLKNKLSLLANSRALKFLRFDFAAASLIIRGTTGATAVASLGVQGLTFSLAGLRVGIRATLAALGPIGIGMLAIGIAMEVVITNSEAIEKGLQELWKILKDMIPALETIEQVVATLFPPEVEEEIVALNLTMSELEELSAKTGLSIGQLTGETDKLTQSMSGLEKQTQFATVALGTGSGNNLTTALNSVTTSTQEVANAWTGAKKSGDELSGTINSVTTSSQIASGTMSVFSGLVFDVSGNIIDVTQRVDALNPVMAAWNKSLLQNELQMEGNIATIGSFKGEIDKTNDVVDQFKNQLEGLGVEDLEKRVTSITEALEEAREQGISKLAPEFKLAKEKMLPEIKAIADGLNTAFGEERVKSYLNNMKELGALTQKEMKDIADSINNVNSEIDDTKKNFDRVVGLIGFRGETITLPNGQTFRSRIFAQTPGTIGGGAADAIAQAQRDRTREESTRAPRIPGSAQRLSLRDVFSNSAAGAAILRIEGGRAPGHNASQALANIGGGNENVRKIREAISKGLLDKSEVVKSLKDTDSDIRLSLQRLSIWARQATSLIEADDERILTERVSTFASLSRRLGVSTDLVTADESKTVDIFAKLLAQQSNLSEEAARARILGTFEKFESTEYQTILGQRNNLANQLAYQKRMQLFANLP